MWTLSNSEEILVQCTNLSFQRTAWKH